MSGKQGDWRGGASGKPRPGPPEPPARPERAPAPERGRADWRKKNIGETPADPKLAKKDYLHRRDADYEQKVARRRVKLAIWSVLPIVLIVVLIAYLLYLPQKVSVLAWAVTEYDARLPPNAYALEDLDRLARLNQHNSDNITVATSLLGDQTNEGQPQEVRQIVVRALENVRFGGPNKRGCILYLSAHGGVDKDGRACLLLSDSAPQAVGGWLSVDELLAALQTSEPIQQDPRRWVLLVIDSGRLGDNWTAGQLYNGFADALPAAVKAADAKNVYVLHSCSPGQRNWTAPELGGSVFAHFVANGLAGAAGAGGGNEVSLEQLSLYVRRAVNLWVTLHRSSEQHPQLLWAGEGKVPNVALTYRRTTPRAIEPQPDPRNPAGKQSLERLWVEHAKAERLPSAQRDPVAWAEIEHRLVRLERMLLAGTAYNAGAFDEMVQRVDSQLQAITQPAPPADNLVSFTQQQRAGLALPTYAHVRKFFPELTDLATGRKRPEDEPPPPAPKEYREAAVAAWLWLVDSETRTVSPGQLKAVREYVSRHSPPAVEPLEMHFVRLLHEGLEWPVDDANFQPAAQSATVKKALLALQLAEQAAAPADERAFPWIAATVAEADAQRRLADDALFIGYKPGENTNLNKAQQLYDRVGTVDGAGLYGRAIDEARRLAAAFQLRDNGYAKAPHLAAWALGRLRGSPSAMAQALSAVALIEKLHELARALDALRPVAEIDALRTEVAARLQQLQGEFDNDSGRLVQRTDADALAVQQLGDLLALPLVTGDIRNTLRNNYLRMLDQLAQSAAAAGESSAELAKKPTDAAKSDDEYVEQLAALSQHPAALLLDGRQLGLPSDIAWAPAPEAAETPAGGDPLVIRNARLKHLAAVGEAVRGRLAATPQAANALVQRTKDELKRPELEVGQVRPAMAAADRLTRAAAVPLARNPWSGEALSPTRELAQVDRHGQRLWLAQRALDDFWGPAVRTSQGSVPYFEEIAQSQLRAATQALGGVDRAAPEFRALLERRRRAAREFVGAGDRRWLQPEGTVRFFEGAERAQHIIEVQSPTGLPPGETALYLSPERDGAGGLPLAGRSGPVRRYGVSVGHEASLASLVHDIERSPRLDQNQLFATGWFRGHTRREPVFITSGIGVTDTLAAEFEPILPPEILVRGDAQQIPSVLFVFDASGSMKEESRNEAGIATRRLDLARRELEFILSKMADDAYRTGLIFYGHRAGWRDGGSTVIYAPWAQSAGRIPRNLQPPNDVEKAIGLDVRLNDEVRRRFRQELALLVPWGETPLYYSLRVALGVFDEYRITAAAPRQIVVITDGLNEQTKNVVPDADTDALTVENLLKRVEYRDVRIDVIGYDMKIPPRVSPSAFETSRNELRKLAEFSGGRYHNAVSVVDLRRVLEELLTPVKYRVERATASTAADPGDAVPLGQAVPAAGWSLEAIERDPANAQFRIRLFGAPRQPLGADVELLGGESLLLTHRSGSNVNALEHSRYSPAEWPLRDTRETAADPTNPSRRFLVGAHQVKDKGRGQTFRLSVQNHDEKQFTPRPRAMWVEIRPLRRNPSADGPSSFHFFDLNYTPRTPVPVVDYHVPDWPSDATEAEIRVWFTMAPLPPDHRVGVDPSQKKTFTVDALPGVRFGVEARSGGPGDPYQVIVTEDHPSGAELPQAAIEIWPRPDMVLHMYSRESNHVRHEYRYRDSQVFRSIQPEVRVTSRAKYERQAVAIPQQASQPLKVPVNPRPN